MKSAQQIARFDGKNVFLEVLNTMIDKDRIILNFIQYDESQSTGNRQKENLNFFIEVSDFLLLSQDVKSGKLAKQAEVEKQRAEKAGEQYSKFIYQLLGGVSAETLAKRGAERADKKSLSRQFKITPGSKVPWMLSCEHGPGEENETGLIVPKGKPDAIVRIPMSNEDLKKFVLLVEQHIQAYLASTYTTGEAFAGYQDANVMADYYVKKAERMPILFNIQKAKQSLFDVENKELKASFEKRIDALNK